jgi:hypothetical protein
MQPADLRCDSFCDCPRSPESGTEELVGESCNEAEAVSVRTANHKKAVATDMQSSKRKFVRPCRGKRHLIVAKPHATELKDSLKM